MQFFEPGLVPPAANLPEAVAGPPVIDASGGGGSVVTLVDSSQMDDLIDGVVTSEETGASYDDSYGWTVDGRGGGGGYGGGWGWGGGYDSSGNDAGGGGDEPPPGPNCANTNMIGGVTPPDGATYFIPEGVTREYLNAALNYIASVSANNPLNRPSVLSEINAMFTNQNHPHFVDFKDWGTMAGPAGTVSGGTFSYYSEAAGGVVSSSAFEAFGNYFYGLVCTFGGLSPEETYSAAAFVQTGGSGFSDDPQDTPHVTKGIVDAQKYIANPNSFLEIIITNCT